MIAQDIIHVMSIMIGMPSMNYLSFAAFLSVAWGAWGSAGLPQSAGKLFGGQDARRQEPRDRQRGRFPEPLQNSM